MANKTGERKQPVVKMNLYVNGKHKTQVDIDVAHALAATYMDQGEEVWLSRAVVNMDGSVSAKSARTNRGSRSKRKA
jgi:hypothetical protein